jgi:ribosomal protein S18 acetylase RimI-like enzyme
MTICIRRASINDANGIACVNVDTWRTAYHGILPDELLANLSYDGVRDKWENYLHNTEHAVYVAEDDTKSVVGFASCGPDRDNDPVYRGEVYALYVLQKMQRQGIGKRLMQSAIRGLTSRGFSSMIVWVLADNPSRRFYELLGGEHVQTRDISRGGRPLKEVGYGWKNLDSIPAE